MEPLRGGKLAVLPEEDAAKLKVLRPREDVPAWAFHFLQEIDGVMVVLSGMSDLEQVKQNIRTFETENSLNKQETDTLPERTGHPSPSESLQ